MSHAFPEDWRRGFYETVLRRRDIRSFLPQPVPDDVLARILTAAQHAPSVGYCQPWSLLVIRDRQLRERLHAHVSAERVAAAEGFTCDMQRNGPTVIGRNTIDESAIYSTVCAVQGSVMGTLLHGIFEEPGFRVAYLNDLRRRRGLAEQSVSVVPAVQAEYERLADVLEEHLDMPRIEALLQLAPTPVTPNGS